MTSESCSLLQHRWAKGILFRIVNEGDCVHVHSDELSHGASSTTLNSLKDERHAGSVNQRWITDWKLRMQNEKTKQKHECVKVCVNQLEIRILIGQQRDKVRKGAEPVLVTL